MIRDPISCKSADAEWMSDYLELADTLVEGVQAVRRAGETYLPKFVDEDSQSYNFRLN